MQPHPTVLLEQAILDVGVEPHSPVDAGTALGWWIEQQRIAERAIPASNSWDGNLGPDVELIAARLGVTGHVLRKSRLRLALRAAVDELGLGPTRGEKALSILREYLSALEAEGKAVPASPRREDAPHIAEIIRATGLNAHWFDTPQVRLELDQAVGKMGLEPYVAKGRPAAAITPDNKAHPHNEQSLDKLKLLIASWRVAKLPVPVSPSRPGEPFVTAIARKLDVSGSFFGPGPARTMLQEAARELGLGVHVDLNALPKASITYSELIDRAPETRAGSTKPQTWQNYTSRLRAYMRAQGKSDEDLVGPELGALFNVRFAEWVNGKGFTTRDTQRHRSALSAYVEAHGILARGNALPNNFQDALRTLLSVTGVIRRVVAEEIGLDRWQLNAWVRGDSSPAGYEEEVGRLEEYFQLPSGALTSLVSFDRRRRRSFCPPALYPPQYRDHGSRSSRMRRLVRPLLPEDFETRPLEERKAIVAEKVRQIEAGERVLPQRAHHGKLTQHRFILHLHQWPDQPRKEWSGTADGLMEFKTAPTPPFGMQRTSTWDSPRTVEKEARDLGQFFGWLTLPPDSEDPLLRGKGFPASDLTIALLLDTELFEEFLNWRIARSKGINGQIAKLLGMAVGHVGKTGWLRQRPDLLPRVARRFEGDWDVPKTIPSSRPKTPRAAERYKPALDVWNSLCDEALDRYLQLLSNYQGSSRRASRVRPTRDPFLPILPILASEEPIAYLHAMNALLRRDTGTLGATLERHRFMQLTLSQMMTLYPLRARHWAEMTYRPDNSGHLRRVVDERGVRFEIHINREEFKNKNSRVWGPAGSQVAFVGEIEGDLARDIDTYLTHCRPLLIGAHEHDKVFLGDGGRLPSVSTIYYIIKTISTKYLSESGTAGLRVKGVHPFGPHAYRHIIATDAIKATGSIEVAADILLDSVGTTRERYARFLPQDRVSHALGRVERARAQNKDRLAKTLMANHNLATGRSRGRG